MTTQLDNKMNIVIVGHVDHGKSSLIGRVLADTNSLPEGKLEQVKAMCEANSKVFEYAFLLDALDNERDQGITIDMARCFFKTDKRQYIILDAPGHIEFLKNMVTGASRAEAAILVIDAKEGIQENSKRHGLLAHMLGIRQLLVCVNKMDLIDYDQKVFEQIKTDYSAYLADIGVEAKGFIPISAIEGEGLIKSSEKMKWFDGPCILEALDQFEKESPMESKPFRMPLQDVYKFTSMGGDRRHFAGKIEAGKINVGDEVIFYPSGKKSKVSNVEVFNRDNVEQAIAGQSIALDLAEQVYVQRGEVCCKVNDQLPQIGNKVRANIFWMGKKPLVKDQEYLIKIGTQKVSCRLERINYILDSQDVKNRDEKDFVDRHDVADCVFLTKKQITFDLSQDVETTGRFVIVDNYEICGGGILQEALGNEASRARNLAMERELNFVHGPIRSLERAERYAQRPTLIVVTGSAESGHISLAQKIDEILFYKGRVSYYIGFKNIKYGLDTDLVSESTDRKEHIRRLGEVCYLMLDAGLVTVVSARELTGEEAYSLNNQITNSDLLLVSIGEIEDQYKNHIQLKSDFNEKEALREIFSWLEEKGTFFSFK